MSDASDSQNQSGDNEPYLFGGDPSVVEDSESVAEPEPTSFLTLELLRVEPPLQGVEKAGGPSTHESEIPVHRSGRTQVYLEETGPVDRVSTSGEGNPLNLIDDKEEEEEEEEEGETEGVEEKGGDEEDVVTVAKLGREKTKKSSKRRGIPPVKDAINVTVDDDVGEIMSTITESKLDALRRKYHIGDDIVLRIPTEREVACSNRDSLDEVCLFERMFQWVLRSSLENVHRSSGIWRTFLPITGCHQAN